MSHKVYSGLKQKGAGACDCLAHVNLEDYVFYLFKDSSPESKYHFN